MLLGDGQRDGSLLQPSMKAVNGEKPCYRRSSFWGRWSLLGLEGCCLLGCCRSPPGAAPPLLVLVTSGFAPTCVHTQGCGAAPLRAEPGSGSAPPLFLPVSHLTPHQVCDCLFTPSLVRCHLGAIREQEQRIPASQSGSGWALPLV